MASSGHALHQSSAQPCKRCIESVEDTSQNEYRPQKRHAGDSYLPVLTTRALQPTVPSLGTVEGVSIDPIEALYGYPGLKEDMSSIFDCRKATTDDDMIYDQLTDADFDLAFEKLAQVPTSPAVGDQHKSFRSPKSLNSPLQQSSTERMKSVVSSTCDEDRDSFEEDVNWEQVMESIESTAYSPQELLSTSSQTLNDSTLSELSCFSMPRTPPWSAQFETFADVQTEPMLLRPFKTFFRMTDMVSHKNEMFKNQPMAVFELFARIVYTSRDLNGRRQYFQLRDLLVQHPPYLSGTLIN